MSGAKPAGSEDLTAPSCYLTLDCWILIACGKAVGAPGLAVFETWAYRLLHGWIAEGLSGANTRFSNTAAKVMNRLK